MDSFFPTWIDSLPKLDLTTPRQVHSFALCKDVTRHTAPSFRFELRPGEFWKNKGKISYRSEVSLENDEQPIGQETWYGFSLLLPRDFPVEDNRLVLAQWHGHNSHSPALALRYREGQLSLTLRHSDKKTVTPTDKIPSQELFSSAQFERGVWNDFILRTKWSCHKDGLVEAWWNGQSIVSYQGPVGYNDPLAPYVKFGIYCDPTAQTYVSYVSEFRRGNSFEKVDPSIDRTLSSGFDLDL